MEVLETTRLKVIGSRTMHCGGCANTVEFVLRELSGVQQVDANHKTQEIALTYDPERVDLEQVRHELRQLDYQVEQIHSKSP